ncbi:MAG: hypothetical protein JXR63_08695 [Spirochaetales bacterium]|nr:hypothetical protein [Spirochaetales bacterium]
MKSLSQRLQRYFPAAFILEPAFIISVILLIFNDFYLKRSGKVPFIAGKLSDFCLMIIFPFFLCLLFVTIRYPIDCLVSFFCKKKERTLFLPRWVIISALFISATVMTLLQFSDIFNQLVVAFMEIGRGRDNYYLLTKDPSDIVSLVNLIPAALILREYSTKTNQSPRP